jgi:archaemetzincin
MFGMLHCTFYSCLMNGSNHLEEADAKPPHLCPVCLHKLSFSCGTHFDPVKRYQELAAFYRRFGWNSVAEWTETQLRRVT